MQGTAGAAARGHGKIFLALLDAFFFIGAGHRMLEPGRVGGIAGDGDIHSFQMVDGHTLTHVIGAVAVDRRPFPLGKGPPFHHVQLAGSVVEPGFDIGKAVDPGDDIGRILTQAVKDDPERFGAYPVGRAGDADGAFRGGKGFVAGNKGKAFCFFRKQHAGQVTVADTDFSFIGHRAGNAECLQPNSQGRRYFLGPGQSFFDCYGRARGIGPAGIFKADGLHLFDYCIHIDTGVGADLLRLLEVGDGILGQGFVDLVYSSFVSFKKSHFFPLSYSLRGSMVLTASPNRP